MVAIVDLPDDEATAAASLAVAATGAASSTTVELLTPDELDDAISRTTDHRPPGT